MKSMPAIILFAITAIVCAIIPDLSRTVKHLTWWGAMMAMGFTYIVERVLEHFNENRP